MYKKFREFHEDAKFADMILYNGMGGGMSSVFSKKMKKNYAEQCGAKFSKKSEFFSKKVSQK